MLVKCVFWLLVCSTHVVCLPGAGKVRPDRLHEHTIAVDDNAAVQLERQLPEDPPDAGAPEATTAPTTVTWSTTVTTVASNNSEDDIISIGLGGPLRANMPYDPFRAWSGEGVYRPEAVHSETCDTSRSSKVCTACSNTTDCWHGVEPSNMAITVGMPTAGFEYVASFWASCKSTRGYYSITFTNVQNAQTRVYLNDEVAKSTSDDGNFYNFNSSQVGKNAQIKVVMVPINTAGFPASAEVAILAIAAKWVDACMDRNFCLNKLGTGTAAAFELRNGNERQYECLLGTPKTSLTGVCAAWRACFANQTGTVNHEAELLHFLKAVFKTPSSSLVRKERSGNSVDAEGCTDPAAGDAEAVECECLGEIQEQCETAGTTDAEECFKTHLCNHANVCASWKTDAGCPGASMMRREGSRRSSMTMAGSGSLDGSLAGKCTRST